MKHLEPVAAANGLTIAIGSISRKNTASLKLVGRPGYEERGRFRQVAEKPGRVIDVVYFQRSLEPEGAKKPIGS